MRLLVTGAAGFIGRHVARRAASNGWWVRGLGNARDGEDLAAWGIQDWRACEVTPTSAAEAIRTMDAVIHCAGGASVMVSMENPARDFRRTVDSTLSVLEASRMSPLRPPVVLTSSAAVYGAAAHLPLRVGDDLNPASAYGESKLAAERLCRSYSRWFDARTAAVRLFSVYGPGLRKQLLWDGCRRLSQGDSLFSGTGSETRHWLHVEDAATLLLTAIDHASAAAPTVNAAEGDPTAVSEVLTALADTLKVPGPRFSGEVRPGDPLHYHADCTEALSWGWRPRRSLAGGLTEYASWYGEIAQ